MKKELISVVLAGVVALGACGGGDADTSNDAGAGGGEETPTEIPGGDVTYFGTEFAFEGPETIAAGETTMTLDNQGKQPHVLVLFELLEGKTIDDVTTYLEEEGLQGPPPKWVREVKIEAFAKPGKSKASKPADLTAGAYAMICFIPDKESKKPHALLGMVKEITVE